MSRHGPQRYPHASTRYWFQDRYPGDAMESNVGVLHTTEGTSVPGYSGGAVAPNFTAQPDFRRKKLVWFQHFDFDTSSRALENDRGGVETNTMNACQIELVGTCDPKHRHSWGGQKAGQDYLYWPDAPDWALAELAEFVKWAYDEHGIKMESGLDWRAYPDSYGAGGQRMSGSQWLNFYGWCGHQHVPENVHGDPGDIDMARVLQFARGDAEAPKAPAHEESKPKPHAPKVPRYQVTINGLTYGYGAHGDHVTAVDKKLVELGFTRHNDGNGYQPGPNWTDYTTENYADYQRSLGYTGKDADGVPGESSLEHMFGHVPRRRPVVDLSRLRKAARTDPPKHGTPVSYSGAKVVEDALVAEGLLDARYADGHFGTASISAYAALQRRYGYRGADADGVPGRASLKRLGREHGFDVTG